MLRRLLPHSRNLCRGLEQSPPISHPRLSCRLLVRLRDSLGNEDAMLQSKMGTDVDQ